MIQQVFRDVQMAVDDRLDHRAHLFPFADLVHIRARFHQCAGRFEVTLARGIQQSRHSAHEIRTALARRPVSDVARLGGFLARIVDAVVHRFESDRVGERHQGALCGCRCIHRVHGRLQPEGLRENFQVGGVVVFAASGSCRE